MSVSAQCDYCHQISSQPSPQKVTLSQYDYGPGPTQECAYEVAICPACLSAAQKVARIVQGNCRFVWQVNRGLCPSVPTWPTCSAPASAAFGGTAPCGRPLAPNQHIVSGEWVPYFPYCDLCFPDLLPDPKLNELPGTSCLGNCAIQ